MLSLSLKLYYKIWNVIIIFSLINTVVFPENYSTLYYPTFHQLRPGFLTPLLVKTQLNLSDDKKIYMPVNSSAVVILHNKNTYNSFNISPNPANNYITISAPNNSIGETELVLYDVAGKQLTKYNYDRLCKKYQYFAFAQRQLSFKNKK